MTLFTVKCYRYGLQLYNFLFFVLFLQVNNPFIVCMTYAFQTPDKLCFVLDLMNGRLLSLRELLFMSMILP